LNPLNSNGNWDIHTWAANRSQYQGLSIVHMDNIRDTVNRLVLEQPCNASGKAPVILPDHDLFFEGDRNITNGYKMRQQQASYGNYYYQWHLRGWYNIATGQYYDVSSGPLQIELDPELNNVFYADWRPENYPTVMPTQNVFPSSDPGNGNSYTPDTSSFVTTRMYDYSEFYNILGSDVSQNGIDSEGWYDPFPRKGLLFFDHTFFSKSGRVKDDRNDHWIVWKTGTLGNAFQRWDGTKFENVNQYYPEGNEDIFQRYPEDIRRLFPVTAPAPGMTSLGVDYLGEGNYLYVYNPETGYYQFDSDRMGAVYNQAEQRFYVSSDPRQHYLPRDATYYLATGFLPLNDWTQELRAHNGSTNYWFGLSSEIDFWLPDNVEVDPTGQREGNKIKGQNMVFEFSGDDDVWVFLDGELILDLGGIHKKVGGKVDFSTGQVIKSWYDSSDNFFVEEQPAYSEKLKKVLAGEHSLVIYYMERGAHASNCQITFNIIPRWEQEPPAVNTASVVKTWDEAYSRYENLLQETEITLNLWKVRNGNRVGDTPERTVVLPVDEGGEKNWTALFEHLDPAYDYEVEEVIPDEPYTYTSHVTSHHGMTYRYWSLAGISESYIGEQDILIGSNGNNPTGSSGPDVLLAVDDAGNVYSKTAEIMHGTVERTAVAADVIWTVEQVDDDEPTPTHNRHFFLKDAATGKYLAIRGSDGHLFLSANKYALNGNTEDRAAKFYLSPMGDLYDARSAYRLCVTPDGIRAVYEESAEGNIERLDRVFIYADQDISSKVFEYEIRNTPAFEILKLRKISEVLTSDKKEVLLAGAEFRLYRGEADSSGRFSDDQLLMTLVSDSDGILTSTDLQSDWILGADGKTLMLSYGVYTLKEIKAPNGFLIINEMIKLEVLPGRIVMTLGDETREMVLSEDPHTVSPEGTTAVDIYLFEAGITNRPGAELPETGGTGTRPYVLIGSLMTFLALFLLITGKLKGKVSKTDHAA
ncbi:MAG: fibro-slime domain-containing protein, partial [Lachnospiraceae bacterium]|nr:fibro-slime domain-containing protein [Lachnospiraceae bacterium]